jgi:hypothetical protein
MRKKVPIELYALQLQIFKIAGLQIRQDDGKTMDIPLPPSKGEFGAKSLITNH